MSDYTPDALSDRIRKVMIQRRCSSDDAVLVVVEEIGREPAELARWWKVLGPWWVDRTQEELYRMGRPAPRSADSMPPPPARPAEVRPSWRAAVDPLDLVLPVGATGVKKRLGSFTREDVRAVQQAYRTRGQRLLEESDRWGCLADRMADEETLEQTLRRLPDGAELPARVRPTSALT